MLPTVGDLTETDVRILLCLVDKQTMHDLADTSGVKYSYLRNRVSRLKAKNYVKEVGKSGTAPMYQTIRLPETDPLYTLRATASAVNGYYRIPEFFGRNPTILEAFNECANSRNKLCGVTFSTFEVIKWVLGVIITRSHKRSIGEIVHQLPDEKEAREALFQYIRQTELELKLARELYETEFLWEGHNNTWKVISEKPEQFVKAYEEANKFLRKIK